jgi:hypothetical protein
VCRHIAAIARYASPSPAAPSASPQNSLSRRLPRIVDVSLINKGQPRLNGGVISFALSAESNAIVSQLWERSRHGLQLPLTAGRFKNKKIANVPLEMEWKKLNEMRRGNM